MARIRSIHPGLFTDEAFMTLTIECPLAVPLLLGLWCEADDAGAFEWKALTIKARILPAVAADVPLMLEKLAALEFIRNFSVGGKQIGVIRNFAKFQRPKKPMDSHPFNAETRAYAGFMQDGSRPHYGSAPAKEETVSGESDVEPEPVRNQFGTSSELSRQMEEGGGKGKSKEPSPPSITAPREGGGDLLDCVGKVLSAYPKSKTHSQPRALAAIEATPADDWPALVAGCSAYAAEFRAKPTSHPIALDRFIRERLFENYAPKSATGPPRTFVEADTPEWLARVSAGHRPSLRTAATIEGRRVEGWHFPSPTSPQTGLNS